MQIRSRPLGLSIVYGTLGALAQDGAVYHIDDAAMQGVEGLKGLKGLKGLHNLRDHQGTDPFMPSGVVRLARRQAPGAAYVRP